MRVLVLGGYGNFGAVIAAALAGIAGVRVLVGGRDTLRAEALARTLGGEAAGFDLRAPGLAERLAALRCDWVVHTAGPFQHAGYEVARACLAAGVSYADIADARDFVCGIGALDAEARRRGVLLVSGASSVPALSCAVVDHHAAEFAALERIDTGIATSSRLPGRATVAGVLGGCGRPFDVWRGGRWARMHGWQRPRRQVFDQGRFARWIADCDVPDLALFPQRFGAETVTFGAGAGGAHALAALYAASWWGRVAPLPAAVAAGLYRLGVACERLGPRGSAMFVDLAGRGLDGARLRVRWELLAEGHEGRHIPCMGAVALVRKALAGGLPPPGARPCVGLLDLGEYLAELKGLPVRATVRRG